MEMCIFICLCTDPANSGNVLQDFAFTVFFSLANNAESGLNIRRKCAR